MVLLVLGTLGVAAQSMESQYVQIYNVIQLADSYHNAGQPGKALPHYLEAQSALERLQRLNPEWNPKVVNFRLNYLADKITALSGSKPTAAVPSPSTNPAPPATLPAPAKVPPAAPPALSAESQQQLAALQNDVNRLQSEKAILEAKLKEALATQPAAVDPRELAKAQEKIQALLKDNELLKTSLAREQTRPAGTADPKELDALKQSLAESNRKLDDQNAQVKRLLAEQETSGKRIAELTAGAVTATDLAAARLAAEEANRRLIEQKGAADKLATEKTNLEQRVSTLATNAAQADALRAENELLKQQLAEATNAPASAALAESQRRQLAEAETRIALLTSESQVLTLEKSALENRLTRNAAALEEANRTATASRAMKSQVEQLTREVTGLRARIEVFEAKATPYSAEELALFDAAPPQFTAAASRGNRDSSRKISPEAAALAAEAQQNFAAKDYPKAEANYLDILKQDDQNAKSYANLATIQMEMGRLEEAEKNLRAALAVTPDDAFTLLLLGNLKFRQEKYDDALEALSKAAKLNPQSSEIQNLLGVTLSQKGLRGPAETALRRALQIDPNLGSAHNNLAVIYATQTPPLLELARWHYLKARANGHAKNAELEKLFEKKSPAPQ